MSEARTHNIVSPGQLRTFALLLPVFCALLGLVIVRRPNGLVVAAVFCATATLASVIFNSENRLGQFIGMVIPAVLMVLFAPVALGVSRVVIAIVLVAIGVLVGVSMLLWPITARNIYDGWQRAAEPIGASVSLAVLSVAYYLVLFPVAVL